MNNNRTSKVVGMPGISNSSSEVSLMQPRSFDEMPQAIQALRERKTVILNLTMMAVSYTHLTLPTIYSV